MVGQMADFFAPQAEAAHIHLRTEPGAKTGTLNIDAGLVKQALLNLLINAVQAMSEARNSDKPHGGCDELIIRTERQRDAVLIHVIDTGPGVDLGNSANNEAGNDADQIFQPYVTSKQQGSGLGLPTSRRIVEEHRGTLTCHSEPGRGTDFVIALPLDEPSPAEQQ